MNKDMLTILQNIDSSSSAIDLEKAVDTVLAKIRYKPKADIEVPDGAKEGRLSNLKMPESMVPASHVRNLLIEIIMLNRKNASLQAAFKAVQSYVDTNYLSVVASATSWITSRDDAIKASEIYSSTWFSSLPYSIEAKIQIAQGLINSCEEYNISNGYWENLTQYQDSAVNFSAYNPTK